MRRFREGIMRSLPVIFIVVGWAMANSQVMLPVGSASKEGADILDNSICRLSPDAIATSGKNVLKHICLCETLTPAQVKAIQSVLRSGDSPFKPPMEWTSSTVEELKCLINFIDSTILEHLKSSTPTEERVLLLQKKALSKLLREKRVNLVQNLKSSRRKRATAECPPDKTVTQEIVNDDLMPLDYTAEELRACLKGPILADNFDILMDYPFTDEQLCMMKENLDEMYPNGYPASIAQYLGNLKECITPDDFKKWNITSAEILSSLLVNHPDDKLAAAIIQRYTDSGSVIDAPALKAIGSRYICLLSEDQLKKIDETAFKEVTNVDVCKCTQTTKDILYPKVKRALSDRHNEFPYFYDMIKPYLGGAPGEDLIALGKNDPNMDIKTFKCLHFDAIMELKSHNVKALLGRNLGELRNEQSNFPIKDWICKQDQSDLDELGIGLHCGAS